MRNFIDIITNVPAEVVLNESAEPLDVTDTDASEESEIVEESDKPSLQSYYDKAVSLHEGLHGSTISDIDVQGFIQGYVACLLWSSTDNHDVPLDKNFDEKDFSPEAHDRIEADCRSFLHTAAPFLTADRYKGAKLGTLESHAGHDFWLTRVGHGSGFWDGDWEGEESGIDGPLTKAARAFGNLDPYVGDDGKIHLA